MRPAKTEIPVTEATPPSTDAPWFGRTLMPEGGIRTLDRADAETRERNRLQEEARSRKRRVAISEKLKTGVPALPPWWNFKGVDEAAAERRAEELAASNRTPEEAAADRAAFMAQIAADDESVRTMVTALRLRGYETATIAKGLGITVEQVRRVMKQSRMDGNLNDVTQELMSGALPMAVEALMTHLREGRPYAVKATLQGLGAFQAHHAKPAEPTAKSNALEITFTMPTAPAAMNPRGIVGAPRGQLTAGSESMVTQAQNPAVDAEILPAREGDPPA